MGLTWEEVEASAQNRQTACGPMHRRCWMNQVKSSPVKASHSVFQPFSSCATYKTENKIGDYKQSTLCLRSQLYLKLIARSSSTVKTSNIVRSCRGMKANWADSRTWNLQWTTACRPCVVVVDLCQASGSIKVGISHQLLLTDRINVVKGPITIAIRLRFGFDWTTAGQHAPSITYRPTVTTFTFIDAVEFVV